MNRNQKFILKSAVFVCIGISFLVMKSRKAFGDPVALERLYSRGIIISTAEIVRSADFKIENPLLMRLIADDVAENVRQIRLEHYKAGVYSRNDLEFFYLFLCLHKNIQGSEFMYSLLQKITEYDIERYALWYDYSRFGYDISVLEVRQNAQEFSKGLDLKKYEEKLQKRMIFLSSLRYARYLNHSLEVQQEIEGILFSEIKKITVSQYVREDLFKTRVKMK